MNGHCVRDESILSPFASPSLTSQWEMPARQSPNPSPGLVAESPSQRILLSGLLPNPSPKSSTLDAGAPPFRHIAEQHQHDFPEMQGESNWIDTQRQFLLLAKAQELEQQQQQVQQQLQELQMQSGHHQMHNSMHDYGNLEWPSGFTLGADSPMDGSMENPTWDILAQQQMQINQWGPEFTGGMLNSNLFLQPPPPVPSASVPMSVPKTHDAQSIQSIKAPKRVTPPSPSPASVLPAAPARESDEAVLGTDIASAVAGFLSGEFLDGSDGEASEDEGQKQFKSALAATARAMTTPAAKRGQMLALGLQGQPLPPGILQEQMMPKLACALASSLLGLRREGVRPTVGRIQARLRERSVDEMVVQALLPLCARDLDSYVFVACPDGQICILLAGEPVENPHVFETMSCDEPYSPEFLEEFVNAMNQRFSKEPQKMTWSLVSSAGSPPGILGTNNTASFVRNTDSWPPSARPGMPSSEQRKTPTSVSLADALPPPTPSAMRMGSANDRNQESPPQSSATADRNRTSPSLSSPNALGAALRQQGVVTLMVRNLPFNVTQKRFVEELALSGFVGQYDFCYMPSMFGSGVGKGYAFVNFTSPEFVPQFVSLWHGSRRFGVAPASPALNVSAAALQGREQNAKKWDAPRMRRVRNPALRPVVVDDKGVPDTSARGSMLLLDDKAAAIADAAGSDEGSDTDGEECDEDYGQDCVGDPNAEAHSDSGAEDRLADAEQLVPEDHITSGEGKEEGDVVGDGDAPDSLPLSATAA